MALSHVVSPDATAWLRLLGDASLKATVVLTRGFEPGEALVKELQEHVKKVTAPYKYPRVIEFVKELPKTISGKIRRVAIREDDRQKPGA